MQELLFLLSVLDFLIFVLIVFLEQHRPLIIFLNVSVFYKLSKRKTDENIKLLHSLLFGKKAKVNLYQWPSICCGDFDSLLDNDLRYF